MDSSLSSGTPSSSRKRPRENETESQRQKREKAAERQRRKRERDRNGGAGMASMMGFASTGDHHQPPQHIPQHVHPQPPPVLDYRDAPDYPSPPDLTPDEIVRRDRVRSAARERQRKHRLLVKQRKMRELGMDMGNEIMPGMEEVHYRVGADGQYQQVLPHELQGAANGAGGGAVPPPQPPPGPSMTGPHEPPFPQGQQLGGQTFASTLLLSFSCAPLLKQHLLRTLHMSNEELASLEPVLAEAWERWDHARRAHYAEQAAKAGLAPPNLGPGPPYPVELSHEQAQAHAQAQAVHAAHAAQQAQAQAQAQAQNHQQQQQQNAAAYALPTTGGPADTPTNEFRARFHRPLVAPTPFRTYAQTANANSTTPGDATPASSAPSAPPPPGGDAIDPHLSNATAGGSAGAGAAQVNGASGGGTKSESEASGDVDFGGDDPDFG